MIATAVLPVATKLMEETTGTSGTSLGTMVTDNTSIISGLLSSVWTMMTANPLLVFFLVVALVGVGISLFRRLKRTAR